MRHRHASIGDLVEYRARLKVFQSFTHSLAWAVGHDGRIHPSFLAHGTGSGRFSGKDPNFQNIPKRHKILSTMVRKAWFVRKDWARLFLDYSQVELRVLAHGTQCRSLQAAYQSDAYEAYLRKELTYDQYRWARRSEPVVDVHGLTAKQVFHVMETDPTWDYQRRVSKKVNFGVPYGGGAPLLMGDPDIRMSEDDAKDFLRRYHYARPEINATKQRLFDTMRSRNGTPWFMNWAGLKVHGPRLRSSDEEQQAEEERSMFACYIQGGAGMFTRISLVRWYIRYMEGSFPAVATSTVHDEIAFDCEERFVPYVASEAQRFMEDFPVLGKTPVIADIEITRSHWGDVQKYDIYAGLNVST